MDEGGRAPTVRAMHLREDFDTDNQPPAFEPIVLTMFVVLAAVLAICALLVVAA